MKETRYFYAPEAKQTLQLPDDEAGHALRVLRLGEGDELNVVDGKGGLYRCRIVDTSGKRCRFEIIESQTMPRRWDRGVHLAVAPTKNIDRMEWLAEKATEIGVDTISFLECQFSERRVLKLERLDKIAIAAMKQSHKFYKPQLEGMIDFKWFVERNFEGRRFIAHCYDDEELLGKGGCKPFLLDEIGRSDESSLVLVGPEGDFSAQEVKLAIGCGFEPVSLGTSRLRTETAALVAVHLMGLRLA